MINKKDKKANVKPFMAKNYLWVFVNCLIENPAFDSQVGGVWEGGCRGVRQGRSGAGRHRRRTAQSGSCPPLARHKSASQIASSCPADQGHADAARQQLWLQVRAARRFPEEGGAGARRRGSGILVKVEEETACGMSRYRPSVVLCPLSAPPSHVRFPEHVHPLPAPHRWPTAASWTSSCRLPPSRPTRS